MLPTGGRASDVSFVASNSMFHDPELSVWNVMGSSPQQSVSLHLVVVVAELDLYDRHVDRLLAGDDAERSSNAFVLVRPLMDRAHEYDRLDEAFLAGLRLILTATYLKNTAKICTKISLSDESPIITS